MLRNISVLILPAMFFLISPTPASGQWYQPGPIAGPGAWSGDALAGTYVNTSADGYCYVSPSDRGYRFVNERGTPALFEYAGPGRLQMVAGQWDPNIVATVSQDGYGRTVIRFDAPYTATGYWVKAR